MKNLKNLLLAAVCFLVTTVIVAHNPVMENHEISIDSKEASFILISEEDLTFKMERSDFDVLFENVFYNDESKELVFSAKKEINFVQILTDTGELKFQLPVLSKKLYLSIEDLDMGGYVINLISTGPYTLIAGELLKKI